tara:strand:- start:400 stop:690 length:291 start_codon:yes stop_codon:yes gene_type:complete
MKRPNKKNYLTTNQIEYNQMLNKYYDDLEAYIDILEKQLTLTDVAASLPDANKLYKMAETIVSKQVLIYNMPENRQIDWEDLKNDWFYWLDEEIKG